MVKIQCPNCDDDIEFEDGDFGLFDCPHCDEEFSWDAFDVRMGVLVEPS
jgi:ribosomal protein L37AE/L43A